ncbi:hypothetical protein H8356DRAFT_944344 [Neocallimastix lanati (nom. inval.)]|uniref:Biogenesis of lysosome-related organelles complex 1 subunit 7 n=1 Tax=Neocallimastix californiae TaxID=1754190 RepID=A0A1Y2EG62_9FUNG|nr:hypothetical protein H8356DRAFT_944344 [Neocallimastix sp. JGI-2020a]ORY70559.1 hypothetical protein LY90DRAFT_504128 [Neocallimastix californiae]|eukprot:ORY70559.1 hypothetical protein LY90DRAFT_504128 [Neocallimastix californiae]
MSKKTSANDITVDTAESTTTYSEQLTEPSTESIQKTKNNIMEKVTPLIQELDMQVVGVRLSQMELFKEIERLSAELQLCIDVPDMPEVNEGVQRLQNLRKRLQIINKTLIKVQERLNRVASINNIQ